jgi:D-methionine transport system permease protein
MSFDMLNLFITAFEQTVLMVVIPGVLGAMLGLPMGIWLYLTSRGGLMQNKVLYSFMSLYIDVVRSTPFIILLVAIIPLTRALVGSSIGTTAAMAPLTIAAAPFVARLVEAALREVDQGLIEAAQAMGATTRQIVRNVLLPEAMPSIVAALTLTFVSLVGYAAMAGAIGGGGLGDVGIRYGYQRFRPEIMLGVVMILVVFVQFMQWVGNRLVRRLSHK